MWHHMREAPPLPLISKDSFLFGGRSHSSAAKLKPKPNIWGIAPPVVVLRVESGDDDDVDYCLIIG